VSPNSTTSLFKSFGNSVIISKQINVGDIVLYFNSGTQLSEDFCKYNNLYSDCLLNLNTNKTGYFTFNEEDTIVKGDVASSILFADLEMLYDDVVVITTIDIADYGSTWMQHIELLCR
jgi:Zn-dependent M16 (insulinase) family peptidase